MISLATCTKGPRPRTARELDIAAKMHAAIVSGDLNRWLHKTGYYVRDYEAERREARRANRIEGHHDRERMSHKGQRPCDTCRKLFRPLSWRTKYCCEACRIEGQRYYQAQWYQRHKAKRTKAAKEIPYWRVRAAKRKATQQ